MGRQAVSSSFALCIRPLAHITSYRAWSIDARTARSRATSEGGWATGWLSTTCRSMGASGLFALIAILALALGTLVYVFDRPQASVYFLPNALSFAAGHRPYFGVLGGQIPDFVHV